MNIIHDAGILHISAHSCVDFVEPHKSAIVLSKSNDKTDNLIKYDDIAELDLKSQMVILSACSSASGKISEAEGVSSLSKAFFEAGSQSVVGSYWSVPDEVSKLFMELFYKKLKEGKDKDAALREVKLEFISNSSLVNPYYQRPQFWAAWSLYGDVKPLKVSDHRWWWVLGSLVVLSLGVLYVKRRSQRNIMV
jgi:CHAT domain-containing protein